MIKRWQNIILLLFLGLLVSSCTKRVDIPLKSGDERLVVEGYLFGSDSTSWVRLTKTSGYFSNEPPPAVSHANIVVSHNNRQWKLTESSQQPGFYYLSDSTFHLIVSDTFKLHIQLQKPVGKTRVYESQTVVPALRIHIDSIMIGFVPALKKWLIWYFGQDLQGKDYYLFNSQVNGKIISDSILQKTVLSDVFFDGRYISGYVVQVLNKEDLKVGDNYILLASNITQDYYDYLTALQEEVGDKNPLFSGPPANVKGNINHGALGFFTSFQTISSKVTVNFQTNDR